MCVSNVFQQSDDQFNWPLLLLVTSKGDLKLNDKQMILSLVSMQLDQAFLADIANKWICQISNFWIKSLSLGVFGLELQMKLRFFSL